MELAALLLSQLSKFRQRLTESIQHWQELRARIREASRPERELRGMKLLQDWLSADQLSQFNRHGHFEVHGCQTGKRYRIRYGTATYP
jgi:hypothetical protein